MTTTTQKYWVSMTDKFMSGWGMAEGKISKYVVECDNYEDAELIEKNAELRGEMKYINICINKPNYSSSKYHVSNKHFNDLGGIWKK